MKDSSDAIALIIIDFAVPDTDGAAHRCPIHDDLFVEAYRVL